MKPKTLFDQAAKHHSSGDIYTAADIYRQIVTNFPDSDVAEDSRSILDDLNHEIQAIEEKRKKINEDNANSQTHQGANYFLWPCRILVTIGIYVFLSWLVAGAGVYSTSPTVENFANNTSNQIFDLLITFFNIGVSYLGGEKICSFIWPE